MPTIVYRCVQIASLYSAVDNALQIGDGLDISRMENRMLTALTEDDLRKHGRGEAIALRLRDAICDGTLRPGERLIETGIAKMLGVSRTPVREAIEKLLVEGLLSNSPSRGVVVTELSRSQVIQIYALRGVLEGAAAGFAAQHASQAEIDELVSIHDTLGALLDAPDRLLKANRRFHNAIHSAAHNQYLIEATSRLADALSLLPGTTFSAVGRPQAAQAEHGAIIDAIVRRDAKHAEIHAREHIESARRVRLSQLFGADE